MESGGHWPLVYDLTRFINKYKVLVEFLLSTSIVGLMNSALALHLGDLGSIPGWGINEISSKFPDILFISKEILNAEISKIGP